jgi:two-component system capsular synthesis sensor histidine kinase RcsC
MNTATTANRSTVLIVEDEELVAMSARSALQEVGLDAIYVTAGIEALRIFSSRPFCAAIIDVGLPDMDGQELAYQLRARDSSLPIVVCTGFDATQYETEFRNDPRVRVIGKPFDEPQLFEQLELLGVRAA